MSFSLSSSAAVSVSFSLSGSASVSYAFVTSSSSAAASVCVSVSASVISSSAQICVSASVSAPVSVSVSVSVSDSDSLSSPASVSPGSATVLIPSISIESWLCATSLPDAGILSDKFSSSINMISGISCASTGKELLPAIIAAVKSHAIMRFQFCFLRINTLRFCSNIRKLPLFRHSCPVIFVQFDGYSLYLVFFFIIVT